MVQARIVERRGLHGTAASAWYLNHSRVVEALSGLPRSQWIRLRAEDLLREPDVVLPRVLDWLRLPCSDEIIARMRRTDLWPFAGFGPSGRLQGGDPKFFGSPALRPVPPPGPVVFDPALGLPDEMCRRMKLLASYLGY